MGTLLLSVRRKVEGREQVEDDGPQACIDAVELDERWCGNGEMPVIQGLK